MTISRCTRPAIGLAIALTLSATPARAQTDTTRRATSEQRIPIRKEQNKEPAAGRITRRESGGEVRLPAAVARVASLEAAAELYRQRVDALEAANARLASHSEATDRLIASLNDSLRMVRGSAHLGSRRAHGGARRTDRNHRAHRGARGFGTMAQPTLRELSQRVGVRQ
jgi:hypothetical protein